MIINVVIIIIFNLSITRQRAGDGRDFGGSARAGGVVFTVGRCPRALTSLSAPRRRQNGECDAKIVVPMIYVDFPWFFFFAKL